MTNRKPTKIARRSRPTRDHEVITPPHRAAQGGARRQPTATTIRSRAPKRRWRSCPSDFAQWMQAECERLEAARQQVAAQGLYEKTHDELFRAAHDIKRRCRHLRLSRSWPARADSLCRLLEHTPELARIPLALVDQHVDAVRAIVREYSRPDLAEMATALTGSCAMSPTNFWAAKTATGRITWKAILAPPLAPGVPESNRPQRFDTGDRTSRRPAVGFRRRAIADRRRIRPRPARRRTAAPLRARLRRRSGAAASAAARSRRTSSRSQRVSTRSTMRRLSRAAPPGSTDEPALAHRLDRLAECRIGRGRQPGLVVERAEAAARRSCIRRRRRA